MVAARDDGVFAAELRRIGILRIGVLERTGAFEEILTLGSREIPTLQQQRQTARV